MTIIIINTKNVEEYTHYMSYYHYNSLLQRKILIYHEAESFLRSW
jgi:hypothetical protein